jgi:alkanesulfonate monooxygenase SsuD/methylene tetrahydromethanopterin reductase-like flavin-dependent oxidoreductase (luciferase family)
MGLRPDSPLTALRETITVVRRLLSGETVTFHGETVTLDDVRLEAPPAGKVPVLAGVRGPRSMVLAGEVADGIILAEPASPSYVRWARQQADAREDFEITVFAPWFVVDDGDEARSKMAAYVARELEHPSIGWRVLPFFEDLMDRRLDGGAAAIASMPLDWWHELAPIGTPADAHEHLDRLVAAGVHRIGAYPAPEFDVAMRDIDAMIEVARAR